MTAIALTAKNLAHNPDELRRFDHGQLSVVEAAGVTVGRAACEPGWRWSGGGNYPRSTGPGSG